MRACLNLSAILLLNSCLLVNSGCDSSEAQSRWASHTQGLPFTVGYSEGLAEVRATGKPAMFFVTATWCGWCKKLAKDTFTDSEVKKLLDRFVLVLVDGDTEAAAARSLGARGYPYVVFQAATGETLQIVRGYVPADRFKRIVQSALNAGR